MKFVIAHNYYQQSGGEDQVFADEVQLLQSHGHVVKPFATHNDSIEERPGISVACGTIWSRRTAAELRKLFKEMRPNVVHFHNTFPLISPGAYYAARAVGGIVVQTLHNFRLLCPQATFFRDGKLCEDCLGRAIPWPAVVHGCYRGSRPASAVVAAMLVAHRALGTWLRTVDVYIALTDFARRKFIQGGLPADKIAVKPNFVHPDPGRGRGKGGYAVYVGRLSPEKGVETLIRAWQRIGTALPLKIVGDGPLAPQVRQLAEQNASVEWLGSQPTAAVHEIMGRAAILVLPSTCYEGLPKTAVEAFAKGTPVIASRLGALTEIVDHQRTGVLFDPGSADDLAAKVLDLAGSPKTLVGMRAEARAEFEATYTAERNYEMLLDIYQQALDGRQQRAGEELYLDMVGRS